MPRTFLGFFTGLLVMMFTACGSGPGGIDFGSSFSNGSTTTPAAKIISGVAATGAPITNGIVTVTDVIGKTATGTTDLAGNFNIDVSALNAPPFIAQVSYLNKQGLSQILYSYAAGSGTQTVNINPLTNAEVSIAAGTFPITFNSETLPNISSQLSSAITALDSFFYNNFGNLLLQSGASITHPITETYKIGTGLDRIFDVVSLSMSGTTLTVKNACNDTVIASSFASYSSVHKMTSKPGSIPSKLSCI